MENENNCQVINLVQWIEMHNNKLSERSIRHAHDIYMVAWAQENKKHEKSLTNLINNAKKVFEGK